ncbi:hypothetical protein Droror1_Dr00026704 [Drosera rotundifolia]
MLPLVDPITELSIVCTWGTPSTSEIFEEINRMRYTWSSRPWGSTFDATICPRFPVYRPAWYVNPEVSCHDDEFDDRKALLSLVLPKDMTLYMTTSGEAVSDFRHFYQAVSLVVDLCSHSEGRNTVIQSLKDQAVVVETAKEEAERVATESCRKIPGSEAYVKSLQEAS